MSWQAISVKHQFFHPNKGDNVAIALTNVKASPRVAPIIVESDSSGDYDIVIWVEDLEEVSNDSVL